jgi:hypothetical protein
VSRQICAFTMSLSNVFTVTFQLSIGGSSFRGAWESA